MVSASTPSANVPHFSPNSTAKTIIKAQISGRMVSGGISDVASLQYTLRKPI